MVSASQPAPASKKGLWAGRIVSALVVLFLLLDSVLHMIKPAPVAQAFAELGYPLKLAIALGILELVCIAVYVIPRSSVLGAILLTGYLGGAVATQLRVGIPLFGEALFPVYIGVAAWAGLFLRDERLRALIPWKRDGS